jgi:hypothetical protein
MGTIVDEFADANQRLTETGMEIGRAITDSLKPIIPDLSYSISSTYIVFTSPSHSLPITWGLISLGDLIEYTFPKLQHRIIASSLCIIKKEEMFGILNALKQVEMRLV